MTATNAPPSRVRVIKATDLQAMRLLEPEPRRIQKLFHAALLRYSGASDAAFAWKKVLTPADRVGIKIQTSPGPIMSTRLALVDAVISSLEKAGVRRDRIVVFDRYAPQMELAGYSIGRRSDGVILDASVPDRGYDMDHFVDLPIPGQLIWGDLEFRKDRPEKEEQISTKSYFSKILTEKVDKVINIAVPMADPQVGLYGCQLSASLSLVDNYRRFYRPSILREDSLTELFSNPLIQKKCVLHILDALIVQYAGGPSFDPSYCWPLQTIYLSRDAVALDSLALQQINQQRPRLEIAPLKEQVTYIQAAAKAGLGIEDISQIDIVEVRGDH